MKKAIFVLVLVLTLLVQVAVTYKGVYLPPSFERPNFEEITVSKAPAEEFSDVYVSKEGIVVIDAAHGNFVGIDELNVLLSRLSARGFSVEYLDSEGDLEATLKYADAFVVISPTEIYSKDEIDHLLRFTEKNGRLLMVHDHTRSDFINTLSIGFGVTFESGYLYNQVENDGNFQYIFLKDFGLGEVTKGLDKVSMYVASPITSTGNSLAYTDENTFSSTQSKQKFTPLVLTGTGNVLAVGDLSFMLEPYNAVFDNNKLISNIADFLTSGGRSYRLTDYPYYLGDDYYLVYTNESLATDAIEIKRQIGKRALMRTDDPGSGDTLVFGTYNASLTQKFLDQAGISVNEKLEITGVGDLKKEGSLVVALTQQRGRRVLTVAADDEEGLKEAIVQLDSLGEIAVTDFVAYFAYEPDKEEIPSETPASEEEEFPIDIGQMPPINESNLSVFNGQVILIQPK